MRVDDFDYDLPSERIALRPVRPRDAARLLVVGPGSLDDRRIGELPNLLKAGDLLIFNDTKVIPAALKGRRIAGGTPIRVEVLLHSRLDEPRWKAFARPSRKLKPGDRLRFGDAGRVCLVGSLEATVHSKGDGGEVVLTFDLAGPVLDETIAVVGHMPLPPYISGKRSPDEEDRIDYQTMFARTEGAVAAPTAGLHFTPGLVDRLERTGIRHAMVTLHVGAGTFLPVRSADTADHHLHAEWANLSDETARLINQVHRAGNRIVAVGTTSLRVLESAGSEAGVVSAFSGMIDLFITPGYRFKVVDVLLTNFHLPRSTLFMLVCAFAGTERMKQAYRHAVGEGYRFYSYGDASLLYPVSP
jgi:S-adenosylmethionine:tRNA ribosyltransferase-isomerase